MSNLRCRLKFFLLAFICFVSPICIAFPCFSLDLNVFTTKQQQGCPVWAQEQIQQDLAAFETIGISQRALDSTLERCIRLAGSYQGNTDVHEHFARYRIINNCVYRHNHTIWLDYFDQVLIRLANTVRLPDVDFILCLSDGVFCYGGHPTYWIAEDVRDQAPLFARAKKRGLPYVPLLPDYSAFDLKKLKDDIFSANAKYPWEKKRKQALWRGHDSERPVTVDPSCAGLHDHPRVALCLTSLLYPDRIDAAFINRAPPLELCCPKLSSQFPSYALKKQHIPMTDHIAYAYLPCLDGIVCTYPGYYWRLLSNSVVLKADSEFYLWFETLLRPYQHYIPISANCSNILEVMDWAQQHDALCKQIANNGTALVLEQLTEEDNYLYVYYALQHYASLQTFDLKTLLSSTRRSSDWLVLTPSFDEWKSGY